MLSTPPGPSLPPSAPMRASIPSLLVTASSAAFPLGSGFAAMLDLPLPEFVPTLALTAPSAIPPPAGQPSPSLPLAAVPGNALPAALPPRGEIVGLEVTASPTISRGTVGATSGFVQPVDALPVDRSPAVLGKAFAATLKPVSTLSAPSGHAGRPAGPRGDALPPVVRPALQVGNPIIAASLPPSALALPIVPPILPAPPAALDPNAAKPGAAPRLSRSPATPVPPVVQASAAAIGSDDVPAAPLAVPRERGDLLATDALSLPDAATVDAPAWPMVTPRTAAPLAPAMADLADAPVLLALGDADPIMPVDPVTCMISDADPGLVAPASRRVEPTPEPILEQLVVPGGTRRSDRVDHPASVQGAKITPEAQTDLAEHVLPETPAQPATSFASEPRPLFSADPAILAPVPQPLPPSIAAVAPSPPAVSAATPPVAPPVMPVARDGAAPMQPLADAVRNVVSPGVRSPGAKNTPGRGPDTKPREARPGVPTRPEPSRATPRGPVVPRSLPDTPTISAEANVVMGSAAPLQPMVTPRTDRMVGAETPPVVLAPPAPQRAASRSSAMAPVPTLVRSPAKGVPIAAEAGPQATPIPDQAPAPPATREATSIVAPVLPTTAAFASSIAPPLAAAVDPVAAEPVAASMAADAGKMIRGTDSPGPPPVAGRAVLPAFRAFASALFEAAGHDARPVADPTAPSALPPLTGVAATASMPTSVDARAPIDLTQPRWPTAMAERIEILRDRADAGDTRIRLVPDALGSIEVAVRQVGDAIHVHFTAAEAQTRAILLDAQPLLARAAADRGMTLGETSVGGGSAQADAQGQRAPQGSPTPTPRAHRTIAANAADPDTRIA